MCGRKAELFLRRWGDKRSSEITPAAPALGEERDGGCDTNSTHVGKYVHFSSAHARLCRAEVGPGVRVRVRLRQLFVSNRRKTFELRSVCNIVDSRRRQQGRGGGRRRRRRKRGWSRRGRRPQTIPCFEAGDVMKMGFLYLSGGSWFSATPCDPPPFTVLHQELVRVLHHRSNGTMAFLF